MSIQLSIRPHQTTNLLAPSHLWLPHLRTEYNEDCTRTSAKSERIVEMTFLLGCKGTKSSFYKDVGRDTYG